MKKWCISVWIVLFTVVFVTADEKDEGVIYANKCEGLYG